MPITPSRNRATAALVVLIAGVLFTTSALAAELTWKWRKGDVHRYRARSAQTVKVDAMGMKIAAKANIDATYALHIDGVDRSGTAAATLVVEAFTVKDDKGRVMASLAALPARALSNPVVIDREGRFSFREILYLLVEDNGTTHLVSAKVDKNGHYVTASAGGQKVTLWARFDRKKGRLTAGYKASVVGKRRTTMVIKPGARQVDVVPKQFLEMLRLPDGPVNKGDVVKARIADWRIDTKVASLTKKAARMNIKIRTPGDGTGLSKPGARVDAKTRGGGGTMVVPGMPNLGAPMPGMGGGMGGMGGAGGMGPGAGQPGTQPASMPSLKMHGDFVADHDMKRRAMTRIKGRIKTAQRMSGMGMGNIVIDTDTILHLSRIEPSKKVPKGKKRRK